MKILKLIPEIIGWLQIMFSPAVIAGAIAFIIYLKWNNRTGEMVALIILALGFITGAVWATRIWKKYGTTAWLSGLWKKSPGNTGEDS
ncbi:MAG: hypothetical protein U0V75_13795 [Ferruginibacter sp.]